MSDKCVQHPSKIFNENVAQVSSKCVPSECPESGLFQECQKELRKSVLQGCPIQEFSNGGAFGNYGLWLCQEYLYIWNLQVELYVWIFFGNFIRKFYLKTSCAMLGGLNLLWNLAPFKPSVEPFCGMLGVPGCGTIVWPWQIFGTLPCPLPCPPPCLLGGSGGSCLVCFVQALSMVLSARWVTPAACPRGGPRLCAENQPQPRKNCLVSMLTLSVDCAHAVGFWMRKFPIKVTQGNCQKAHDL